MKVVITGAECSGKTTLAFDLAKYFETSVITEYSRTYLTNKGGEYQKEDLLEIANGQLKKESFVTKRPLIICDTSLLVLYVWSLYKYAEVDPEIKKMLDQHSVDLYILPHWDIPYEEDVLRENKLDRSVLYQLYKNELENRHLPFTEVKGNQEERLELAVQAINTYNKYQN